MFELVRSKWKTIKPILLGRIENLRKLTKNEAVAVKQPNLLEFITEGEVYGILVVTWHNV